MEWDHGFSIHHFRCFAEQSSTASSSPPDAITSLFTIFAACQPLMIQRIDCFYE
jgi:hypothetical protein